MTTVRKLLHSVFSPPRPNHESRDRNSKDEDHNKNSSATGISSAANVYQQDELRGVKEDRCQFTFSDGRRCRNQSAQLCIDHASKRQRNHCAEAASHAVLDAPELAALCADLTTATNINRALTHVFLLMAQGRISQKQAVAFGYLTQLLLQTVPGIRSEFVSAHGYRAWEQRLKSSLEANQNEAPEPSGDESNVEPEKGSASNVPRTKVMQIRSFRAAKKAIRSLAALKK